MVGELGKIEGLNRERVSENIWTFDEDDWLLYAMLCDPVYCAELLLDDPNNREYAGCYRVRDYQYPLNRPVNEDNRFRGHATSRASGKTEAIKNKSMVHAFKRIGEDLLLTAPHLIHLDPLSRAIEERYSSVRLLYDFLDTRNQRTGFTHRPFGVQLQDGTGIDGRLPRESGVGVKGAHCVDIIIDEAQDYPAPGWNEIQEALEHDHVDKDGNPDFNYEFYGVHSGARDTGFYSRATKGDFDMVTITALQRQDWGPLRKANAKAAYGGTSSPDYQRNILGRAGAAASPYFVLSRLLACVDQNRTSDYNEKEYVHQLLRAEDVDEVGLPIAEQLDLLGGKQSVYGGADIGLTISPTVVSLFSLEMVKMDGERKGRLRLKLFRRYTLERFRAKTIRQVFYAIGFHHGGALKGLGIDATGLGRPIFQDMEDDETAPQHLMDVTRGYVFNVKVPVAVDKDHVSVDQGGRMRDQFGSQVKEEVDPLTGRTRLVTYMPMIEASTRYLADDIDSGLPLLPFDTEVTADMQGETQQRVRVVGELKRKPNAMHILDSFRAMEMVYHSAQIEQDMAYEVAGPVLDRAV